MNTTITIDDIPVAASRPRVTKFSTFYPQKHTEYSNKTKEYLKTLGLTMLTNPISLNISFYVPFPSYASKSEEVNGDGMFGFGKPDIDSERRMGVCLARGKTVDEAVENVKKMRSQISFDIE